MICFNGNFIEESEFAISPLHESYMYGYGVYETLRTYHGQIFHLQDHIERLFNSAEILKLEHQWTKEEIGKHIEEAFKKSGLAESRIKIVLTETEMIVWPQKLVLRPAEWYQAGINVVTYNIERILPEAKSNNSLPFVLAHRYAKQNNVYESLLIDDEGFLREGSISNAFWIKDDVLYTTKNKILRGITRDVVMKIGQEMMQVEEKDEILQNVLKADEFFITNTTSDILPVVQIDDQKIGTGQVGKWTKELISTFSAQT